ncbi:MAG: DUF4145 domain-containing protein [Clostridiales bacterium]|nr:DUF4145 domain-containing protein [Clostridiales bacterium]
MIEFDYKAKTYTCPYCGNKQAFEYNCKVQSCGYNRSWSVRGDWVKSDVKVYHIECSNEKCKQMSVIGFIESGNSQFDIIPSFTCKTFPNYVPKQIRDDYQEACSIIELSPKAAATLLRRCLQGMLHDFWDIHGKNLNAEITQLKDRVSTSQWKAIDGVRSIGNIGAHMEQDINLIIDIDLGEAKKLQSLIELLVDKWYISRHDEEALFDDISNISEEKEKERKGEN